MATDILDVLCGKPSQYSSVEYRAYTGGSTPSLNSDAPTTTSRGFSLLAASNHGDRGYIIIEPPRLHTPQEANDNVQLNMHIRFKFKNGDRSCKIYTCIQPNLERNDSEMMRNKLHVFLSC